MQRLNSSYTTYFNSTHRRTGHLFQGRFKAILVDKDSYLLELSRYVHLNPVRAKLVECPEVYGESSYRAYIGARSRDVTLRSLCAYLARTHTALTNGEIGEEIGDLSHSGVAKAAARFAVLLKKDGKLKKDLDSIEAQLSKFKV